MRFYGESNGCYSETADLTTFEKYKPSPIYTDLSGTQDTINFLMFNSRKQIDELKQKKLINEFEMKLD